MTICDEKYCTGCSACASACPKNCISMEPDIEGFYRPVINNDACINCGKCIRICPINNDKTDDKIKPKTFAIRNKDEHTLFNSSSGGAFSAFAEYILKNNGIVIGAGFDDDFNVVHKACNDIESLDELRRSKYVQSRIGDTYTKAKSFLDENKQVLFVGTPCQIGGLIAFLGKEYRNLITVDFICHGVPSPLVWEKYLEYIAKDRTQIRDISFRSKDSGWQNYSLKIKYGENNEYLNKVSNDMYLRSFILNMDLRQSCYNCKFKTIHRNSDITLADFWGAGKYIDCWKDDKGISLVFVHSEKGIDLIEECKEKMEMIDVDFDNAIKSNPSMIKSVSNQPLRKKFMKSIVKKGFYKSYKRYGSNKFFIKFKRKIVGYLWERFSYGGK